MFVGLDVDDVHTFMSELLENGTKARSRMRLGHVWSGMHVSLSKSFLCHSWCSILRFQRLKRKLQLFPTLALGTAAPSFAANSTTSAANWLMPGIAWFETLFQKKTSVKSDDEFKFFLTPNCAGVAAHCHAWFVQPLVVLPCLCGFHSSFHSFILLDLPACIILHHPKNCTRPSFHIFPNPKSLQMVIPSSKIPLHQVLQPLESNNLHLTSKAYLLQNLVTFRSIFQIQFLRHAPDF